ncbi:hypothetical protein JCM3774_001716 [Rhodotorula dairenensis]
MADFVRSAATSGSSAQGSAFVARLVAPANRRDGISPAAAAGDAATSAPARPTQLLTPSHCAPSDKAAAAQSSVTRPDSVVDSSPSTELRRYAPPHPRAPPPAGNAPASSTHVGFSLPGPLTQPAASILTSERAQPGATSSGAKTLTSKSSPNASTRRPVQVSGQGLPAFLSQPYFNVPGMKRAFGSPAVPPAKRWRATPSSQPPVPGPSSPTAISISARRAPGSISGSNAIGAVTRTSPQASAGSSTAVPGEPPVPGPSSLAAVSTSARQASAGPATKVSTRASARASGASRAQPSSGLDGSSSSDRSSGSDRSSDADAESSSDEDEDGTSASSSSATRCGRRKGAVPALSIRLWTAQEDDELWDARVQDPPRPYAEIASSLRRTVPACEKRYSGMKAGTVTSKRKQGPKRLYTLEEDKQIDQGVADDLTYEEIAKKLGTGRTAAAVQVRVSRQRKLGRM